MPAVTNVLVAGAGLAGTAIATHLAAAGVTVDLIDVKPAVTALGSGISMQSNALRELRALGVLDQVTEHGYAFSSLGLRAPDPAGTLLVELPDRSDGDLPGSVGIPRPVLARIVLDRAAQAGATIRLATSCAGLRQDTDGVDATFADGSAGRDDLVGWRPTAFGHDSPHAGHRHRAATDRDGHLARVRPLLASVTRTDLIYGGPAYIARVLSHRRRNAVRLHRRGRAGPQRPVPAREALATMLGIAAAYHGPWDDIRPGLTNPSLVNYTWFETRTWSRRRGTAAGSC